MAAYQKLVQDGDTSSFQEFDAGPLEGDMSVPGSPRSGEQHGSPDGKRFDTLDEPIKETFKRDLKAIASKFFHVLYPKQKAALLKDWDLWGPLMLCIFLAMFLQDNPDQANSVVSGGPQFTEVFVVVWCGAAVVTINSKLLGGHISFFQSVCVLGYCLLAPCVSLLICRLVLLAPEQTLWLFVIRFFVTMLGFAWATIASTAFLGDSQPFGRKGLAVYPIFLFYLVISWLILSHSP